jgi:plasmid stability protein
MKNVTIALDEETHRMARIRAAELGTSLSALVKDYLTGLGDIAPTVSGVREMPMPFHTAIHATDGPPWLVGGKWVYTRDGKPRQPGGLRKAGTNAMADDWKEWPEDILASFEAWPYDDPDYVPWKGDKDMPST